jgi:membrane-associated phospholipid phosphatase
LDSFILRRNRWTLVLLAMALHAFVYFLPNHFPLRQPIHLPLGPLDEAVPFLPGTIWLYWSEYVLVCAAFLLCPHEDRVRFVKGFGLVVAISVVIQLVFPVDYPRDLFPVVADKTDSRMVDLLRRLDTPTSCFPSLHVGLAVFVALYGLQRHRDWSLFIALWAGLIALSTLTLKQHYVLDVVGGALVGALGGLAIQRWAPVRPLRPEQVPVARGLPTSRGRT